MAALGLAASILVGAPNVAPPPSRPDAQPEPPRGSAMFGGGIFGVAFGIFNIGYGVPLLVLAPGDAVGMGAIPVGFGAAFIALGAVGIHYGKQRRADWRAWADTHPLEAEHSRTRRRSRTGTPELIVGGTLTTVGAATLPPMVLILASDPADPPPFAWALAAMGGSSILCGAALLASGGVARHRHRRAANETRFLLVPTPWATRHAAGIGLAGRF